jgi:hypothetical protein
MTTLNALTAELEVARKLFWLMRQDQIFLSSYNEDKKDWDGGAYPVINCNDVFVPGADAEGLNAEDLDAYIEVVKRWPVAGPLAWCAVMRSANPWRESGSQEWWKEYHEAVAKIPEILEGRA